MANYCSECGHSLQGGSAHSSAPAASRSKSRAAPKAKRQPSAYNEKYGRAFKSVAPKYKKKNGGWLKGGFARAQKAAHKKAKRMR